MKTKPNITFKTLGALFLSTTMLFFASCKGQEKETSAQDSKSSVIKEKVNPPEVDIHTAAFFGNLEAIEQHIKAGSDLNAKDEYGSTPLNIAATFGKTEIAKALINGNADLNSVNSEGSTPLHVAAFFCRTEIVKALLEKGANKELKNNYGSTALESISTAFIDAKPIYDQISKNLGPFGLKLDYKHLEKTRPIISELLK